MTSVNRLDIRRAVETLGIGKGEVVLVHSSFKSMGYVEGGAESVIGGFLDVIGTEGTLVLPTFCQKNFDKVYETWHMDKESDTGYLTNYFRKREGSLRSNQATHSVAACGRFAAYLTETHGQTHKRFGNLGDTPFSGDSPWEKMYQMDAKIVLLGVDAMKTTFRHYAEYLYIEECLKSIEKRPEYSKMKERLWRFGKPGVWPHVYNIWVMEQLEQMGLVAHSCCGNAALMCVSAQTFVNFVLKSLREGNHDILWRHVQNCWDTDAYIEWEEELKALQEA